MSTQAALDEARIGIIGLGYVGLPLAVEFGKHFDTLGFDIDARGSPLGGQPRHNPTLT